MTDGASADPEPGSAVRRASDGRAGIGWSVLDPRLWRDADIGRVAPAWTLIALFVAVLIAEGYSGGPGAWGLSSQALAEGRVHLILAHMIAHAGPLHLLMNSNLMLGVTPVVMMRFGAEASGWRRFGMLFFLSGLAGAALYLALNPASVVPMVGASGAICGVWGAAARIGPDGDLLPFWSARVWREAWTFTQMNLVLFGLLWIIVRLSGGVGGLAWEAHLGGFLFGLFAISWIAPRRGAEPVVV